VTARWESNRINVVELTDFDCSHCAELEAVLCEAIHESPDCHFVRIPAPMPKHENARPAARAFVAASRQNEGERMATLLFAAAPRTPERCRELAAKLGLDMSAYDRDVADPSLDEQFDETIAWAHRVGPG